MVEKAPLTELGYTGLTRNKWAGFGQEEFLRVLQGRAGMQVYREMRDNPAITGAGLAAIEMTGRQLEWYVEPVSQSPEDLDRAAFLETCLHDMSASWAETIQSHLSMLTFGFAFNEIVYKKRGGDVDDPRKRSKYSDGRIGWRKIPLRPQETLYDGRPWDIDPAGGIQAFNQQVDGVSQVIRIPIEKGLLFRTRAETNNPEGRSILRNAYFSWYFAKRLCEVEAIGVSRDLTGVPIIWIPLECFSADATPEAQATLEKANAMVRDMSRDEQEGFVMPLDYVGGNGPKRFDFTLVSTGGSRQFDTSSIIERYERRMAMAMLTDFVLMGHEQVGSFALSSDKTALFATAMAGYFGIIKEVYNSHAIPRLWALNGWPLESCPKLCHGDIETPNLAQLGDYVTKLGPMFNWAGDENLDAFFRKIATLPDKNPDRTSESPKPQPTPAVAPAQEESPVEQSYS